MADDAVFCQACGHSNAAPAQAMGSVRTGGSSRANALWWLLPVFFGVLGGAVSYLAVRDQNLKIARWMLVLGAVLTPLLILIVPAAIVTIGTPAP